MADLQKSEAEAIALIAREAAEPRSITVIAATPGESGQIIAHHSSLTLKSAKPFVDEWRIRPERRVGTAKLGELASFVDHTNRNKNASSALFAAKDPTPSITAIYDYNEAGPEDEKTPRARHRSHRAIYSCPFSEPWKKWSALDGKAMGQGAFAEFIEDNIADVLDPASAGDGAKAFAARLGATFASPPVLMAMSRGLALTVNNRVQNATNLANGEMQIAYVAEHQNERGEPLKVATALVLAVPVFESGTVYQIPVRLRYRVKDGLITWIVQMYRTDLYLDDAFADVCKVAAKDTALPLFMGIPE